MSAFRFKLEPVLAMRVREERERMLELAEVQREAVVLEGEIREAYRAIDAFKAEWREASSAGPIRTSDVGREATAVMAQEVRAQQAAGKLAGVAQRIEAARARLSAASARRRAVELLKERRFRAWQSSISRREANELDDLACRSSARDLRSA